MVNKKLHVFLKVIFALILFMPILGITGILGEATRDLYNTDIAFEFIETLTEIKYINYIMVFVCAITIILLFTGREALASLLILPITVNVVAFHLFIDGGLFTAGAVLGNVMLILNIYLLYVNKNSYKSLWLRK